MSKGIFDTINFKGEEFRLNGEFQGFPIYTQKGVKKSKSHITSLYWKNWDEANFEAILVAKDCQKEEGYIDCHRSFKGGLGMVLVLPALKADLS